jgi:hypothetical protein
VKRSRTIPVFLLLLLCSQALAEPLRIGVFRIDSATHSTEPSAIEAERKRMRDIAGSIKRRQFDVILLPEVRSRQTCTMLVNALKPAAYQIAVCSTFRSREPGAPVRQVAILSQRAPMAAWAEDWRGPAQVDASGGFAFAAFRDGTNTAGFFVLQSADEDVIPFAAVPAAARYLLHHVNWVNGKITNGLASFMIAGDKDWLTPRSAVHPTFTQAGFKEALGFSYAGLKETLLVRNGDFDSAIETAVKTLAGPLIKGELDIRLPAATEAALPNSHVFARWLDTARTYGLVYREELSWATGILTAILLVAAGSWWLRRVRTRTVASNPFPASTFVVEVGPTPGGRARIAVDQATTATNSAGPGEREAQVELWQQRALLAEERARQAAVQTRERLMPLFTEVLKLRLFTWLSAQRNYLLTSHEVGTQQVMQMTQRVSEIQSEFEGRLQTSQQRISELEQDIAAKERTIRDLLRVQVRMSRQSSEP